MAVGEDVYCTLVMREAYLPGAAVLAKSLRDAGTHRKLACMIVQENLRQSTVEELQTLYNYVIPVPPISSSNVAALYLMRRPDLQETFTKIHLWRFTQFRKIVYVDADVVALRAPDELFDIQEDFAAAPDVGFPSIFNSGVMVLSPDSGTYAALRTMANVGDSFDGADQGLLNQYFEFKKWKLLSFTYNCTPNASYQYEPAYRYFKRNISMVHFIGSEKPWQKGRSAIAGSSGAYQELLSRWWAVWDRHFRVSPADFINGLREPPSYITSQQGHNNAGSAHQPYYAAGYPVQSTHPAPAPAPPVDTPAPPPHLQESQTMRAEEPFTDPGEEAQNIDEGRVEPVPTAQARRFSAPHMEWDATRAAPPIESKPEAANFPTTTYEFSTDATPYRPPKIEPTIPENVHYEIPKARTEEKLTPIFPWEEREQAKPTRKFIEDEPPPAPPAPEPEPVEDDVNIGDELEVSLKDPPSVSPVTPSFNTWDLFDARSKNAWDDVSGIETYVRALTTHQRNRGKKPVVAVTDTSSTNPARGHVMTPSTEIKADELVEQVQKRRESLILMDFPSAVERPSLPVTPAPVRRTFWGGDEEDTESSLPPAEGVPKQQDWDPAAQLEQLRRNSLIDMSELKLPVQKTIPDRAMPGTATTIQESITSPPLTASEADSKVGLGVSFSQQSSEELDDNSKMKIRAIATSTEADSRESTVKNTLKNFQQTQSLTSFGEEGDSRVVEMLGDGRMGQSLREEAQKSSWLAEQEGMLSSSGVEESSSSFKETTTTSTSATDQQFSSTTTTGGSGLFGSLKKDEFESHEPKFVETDEDGFTE